MCRTDTRSSEIMALIDQWLDQAAINQGSQSLQDLAMVLAVLVMNDRNSHEYQVESQCLEVHFGQIVGFVTDDRDDVALELRGFQRVL